MSVHPALQSALDERGYTDLTPVQTAVLDEALGDRDLLVSARTGSGKTIAFGLALAPMLVVGDRVQPTDAPLVLIVAPTRELAVQVERELEWLYRPTNARIAACVGGADIRRQLRALHGGAHIVVGTPGRLCDLLDREALDLSKIRAVVLDEADEMLDMGFREELETLLDATPTERRTLLFSATLPDGILGLARRYQRNAARVDIASDEAHADIAYRAVVVAPNEREQALVNLLRHVDAPTALVFVATREGARALHARLQERGFAAVSLSGELSQAERTRSLQALRDGRARVLVATDVAARGLDVPDLGLVVHGDLPLDPSVLLHRSGRTGRAGRKGLAVLIVPWHRRRAAERLIHGAGVEATWTPPPTAEAVMERDQERLIAEITPDGDPAPEDRAVAQKLLAEHEAEVLVAALVRARREELPAPEDLPDTARLGGRNEPAAPARMTNGVWFRINVGRADDADTRWLVPLICRRGRVEKREIGAIRITDRETRFEIDPKSAEAFEIAARRPDRRQPHIRIQRVPVSA